MRRTGVWAGVLAAALGCGASAPSADPRGAGEPSSLGSRQPAAPAVTAPGTPLRIATYNLNFGNGDHPDTIETLAGLDADVVLLQETTPAIERAVRDRLGEHFAEVRFHHCCRAGGLGVLSRYPIVDSAVLAPDIGFFPAWWLRLDTPSGKLVVLDVHLRPPISDGGSWVVGFFSTQDVRAREMAQIWLDVPKGDPIVVAGDFNENAEGGAVGVLAGDGLRSALPQVDPKTHTWHWKVGASTLRMQLDHVIYSAPLQLRDARVVRGGQSDHEPVVVDLIWPTTHAAPVE